VTLSLNAYITIVYRIRMDSYIIMSPGLNAHMKGRIIS